MSTIMKHTTNNGFDMQGYMADLCGFVAGENAIGETLENNMDLSNRATDDADIDARFEAQEARQAIIDAEVETYLQDDASVETLIAENADIVWSIIKSGKDVTEKLNESLKHWAECEAERNLGL